MAAGTSDPTKGQQHIPRLDVLVNNVGGYRNGRHVTADGLERTFALNHLAAWHNKVQRIYAPGLRLQIVFDNATLAFANHADPHRMDSYMHSVADLIAVPVPANSACMSWIDCWPACGARFADIRC